MTTLAQNFISIVSHFYFNYDGFLAIPELFIEAWRDLAVSVEYPLGTDSIDATELWRFEDGSAVLVDNPRQRCYTLRVMEAK
ncbi:hypothetical protein [uncultured Parasutterella sp.]|uniref:hypothetical protein n=1 Tax=uncultured Parasutterella sp. TaxID=1263098 RepID=UPI002593D8AF|nr:hypothetical protein [uncultured Parasutterella sp.]